jgi:hypothetical protein
MSYTLKVDWDALQQALVSALKQDLKYLKEDLARVKKTKKGYIWSLEWEEDIVEIKKHIEAMQLVIKYYGG